MSSENAPPISFEHLPTEIFLQIFSFLPVRELVKAFHGLNSRIDSIIQLVNDANCVVRYNDTDAFKLLQLFPTQIGHLMIVNAEMVDCTSFINLRSLTLKYGTTTQFDSIRPQNIPMLKILYIKGLHTTVKTNAEVVKNLFQVILSNGFPRLRTCIAFNIGTLEFNKTWTGSPNLRILNLNLKTIFDCEQLRSVCPQLHRLTTYDSSMINIPTVYKSPILRRRIIAEMQRLERLELENKFILHDNPVELFSTNKLPRRFNNTTVTHRLHTEDVLTFQGRILPQTEPYCHASFLIEITLPSEYPFKVPQIIFLDPIYHPNISESGKHSCCLSIASDDLYKPITPLTQIIENVIRTIDSPPDDYHVSNYQRAEERAANYQTFYKNALEHTLSYGRPRY